MIGVFDSGWGGLSVLRELQALLSTHAMTYVADTAYCPYGPKTDDLVRERSLTIGRWLVAEGAQALVVACNTASSAALELLRAELPIPVVGMEPGVKPAIAATRSRTVGVLATSGTLNGARFATLVRRFAGDVAVLTQPCPGWVEAVEAGALGSPETQQLVRQFVAPLLAEGADTLVLGCTHYPFLRPLIDAEAGPGVQVIDTGPAVAQQVVRVAQQHRISSDNSMVRVFTTGEPSAVQGVAERLYGAPIGVARAFV